MKPPVFVVGAPRSGTGLLRNLLRTHPNLSFPSESHFLPHFYRAYGDPTSDAEAVALARRILSFDRVRRWGLDLAAESFADCRSYRALVDRIYSAWAAGEGKPRWGDKTPHYVAHLRTLAEIFPSLKVLHIIRDGRAVSSSWAAHPAGPGNHYVAARLWTVRVRAGRSGGASLPPGSYLEVRYEALLADPDAALRNVYAFLDEDVPDGATTLNPLPLPPSRYFRGIAGTEIATGNADAWRERMSVRQRRRVEAVAGPLLAELGYPVEGEARAVPACESLFWRAHAVARHYARLLANPGQRRDNLAVFLARWRSGRRG
jgi:hypothetical protein